MHEYQRKSLPPGTSVVESGRLSAPAEAPERDPWMGHSRKDGGSSLSALLFFLKGPQQSLRLIPSCPSVPGPKTKELEVRNRGKRSFIQVTFSNNHLPIGVVSAYAVFQILPQY